MKLRVALAGLLALSSISLCATSAVATQPASSALSTALQTVSAWSTNQLANEVVSVSVSASNIGSMAPAAKSGYGGLLLFGATGSPTTAKILATLQSDSSTGMLIMTDEEGGGVMRLSNLVSPIPWAQTMGKTLSVSQVQAVGAKVGKQLLSLGVNTDLAPVLDVDGRAVQPGPSNPDGLRSFGGSASLVAKDGSAFMQGLQEAGMVAVVKHFPGLGHATANTDFGPAQTLPWNTLQQGGLLPFEAAISQGATAVMMSNATVPGFSTLPASISPTLIAYLRNQLGFTGLIMTDSLSAGALSALRLNEVQASIAAITAGADLVLYGSPASAQASLQLAQKISAGLVNAVATGALPLNVLQNAAAHVLMVTSGLKK